MNPRRFIEWLKSPSGRLLGFCLLLAGGLGLYALYGHKVEEIPPLVRSGQGVSNQVPQRVETVRREIEPFRPPPPPAPKAESPAGKVVAPAIPAAATNASPPPVALPLSLRADSTVGRPRAKCRSEVYAPYGRLIPCQTVITVDSSSIQTPIVGLISEDIYHAGRLVLPAGTEVHGSAQVDRSRERIASSSSWTLVFQSGEILRLRGIALDREFENDSNHVGWGITDGSAGLRGRVLKSDDLAELKLYGATLLSGVAEALTEKEPTLWGPVDSRSLNNAPLKGAEDVLATYAKRVLDSIERDGFFIRVPSGKPFYLYALQSIDRADARLPDGSEPEITDANPQSAKLP